MLFLGIESSCDETAASVVEYSDGVFNIKSNIIASQIKFHERYGGVVPEIASRMHIEAITGVVSQAMEEAQAEFRDLTALTVTYAPGLIGALLVGVNYAKSLAYALDKPLIPVHHIEGHISALYLENPDLKPPFVCLVASGGHSTIVHVKDYLDFETIASTRDDAAGEAFDKIARVIGLGYPGGPKIQKYAEEGNEDAVDFPIVKMKDGFDFSFSGVKTAVINYLHNAEQKGEEINKHDIAASFQRAVCTALSERLVVCAKEVGATSIGLAGGVAANDKLREMINIKSQEMGLKFYYPSKILCTDNAAMIAARGAHIFDYSDDKNFGCKLDLNALSTKDF
ncbi:MAG: tRNA (adenosine(37)-N6)-threonylcarbamoyltransferase complex transferase subunit TsaD [Eubacteriales bacterium]|nr:tRNA (adenosine(37)-N6)-threonylcarbamoyltransferase complex transferase subunit TsaD [Eubacteriales bacterium]